MCQGLLAWFYTLELILSMEQCYIQGSYLAFALQRGKLRPRDAKECAHSDTQLGRGGAEI